jgi:hypothetical protein
LAKTVRFNVIEHFPAVNKVRHFAVRNNSGPCGSNFRIFRPSTLRRSSACSKCIVNKVFISG